MWFQKSYYLARYENNQSFLVLYRTRFYQLNIISHNFRMLILYIYIIINYIIIKVAHMTIYFREMRNKTIHPSIISLQVFPLQAIFCMMITLFVFKVEFFSIRI